jgi:hypothetical protein
MQPGRMVGLLLAAWILSHRYVRADASGVDTPSASTGFWDRLAGRVEIGMSGRSDTVSRLWAGSAIGTLDYAFSQGWGVGVDWSFFAASEVPASDAAAAAAVGPGDPWLKVWNKRQLGSRDTLQLFAGATVPVAWLPRDATRRSLYRSGYAFGAASRGLWNAWLWAPAQISIAAGVRWFHELGAGLRLGADAGLGGGLDLVRGDEQLGSLYLQVAPSLELAGELLVWGARMQAVMTDTPEDLAQLSASSYVQFHQPGWHLEVAGLCNLDAPLGVVGSGLSVCGATVALAVNP